MEKGLPIETREPNKKDDHDVFPGQSRAPYEQTTAPVVTVLTDKLQNPWSMAFLPDGKILITEKPGRMRTLARDGTLSEPLTGVPAVYVAGQVGLLDVALDKNFARNRRIFFSYAETVGDTDSHIVVASATLNPDATAITGSKVIFGSMPALNKQRFGANQGGRIAIDRDGNLFVTIGDRAHASARLRTEARQHHRQDDPHHTGGQARSEQSVLKDCGRGSGNLVLWPS